VSKTKIADDAPGSFEDALARLERIAAELESGDCGLQTALQRYEEGVRLLARCQDFLQRAERRIELLTGVDAEGRPVTEAFDDTDTATLKQKGEARPSRRAGGKRSDPPPDSDPPGVLF